MTITRKQIISLFLILSLLFALPIVIFLTRKKQDVRPLASIAGRANIMMSSDVLSTNVGQSFNVWITLQLTDPDLKVSAMDFMVLYDKSKLDVVNIVPALTSIDPKAPFTDANIITSGGSFDSTFNFVRVAEYARKYNSDLKSGTFNVAQITFRARNEGKAAIKLPDDNKYLEIVGINSAGSNQGATPTPTTVVAGNAVLALIPSSAAISVNGIKSYELQVSFPQGSANQKLDYFKTEISFNNAYLQIPAGNYADTSLSGFDKIFRVDGPTAANESGKIVIELGAKTPGGGPAMDKTITIAKFNLSGKSAVSSSQNITIANTQIVNNQSQLLNITTQPASFTVGQ